MRISIHIEDASAEQAATVLSAMQSVHGVQGTLPFASPGYEGVGTTEKPEKAEEDPKADAGEEADTPAPAKKAPAKKAPAKKAPAKKAPAKAEAEQDESLEDRAVQLATQLLADGQRERVVEALGVVGVKKVRELNDDEKLQKFLEALES